MEKTEGLACILLCSFLCVRNKLTLIVASRTELQATSAIICLKNIGSWWDEAPCESCQLLADRCVQETSTRLYVVSRLLGSDLVFFLAVCLKNWIMSSLEQFHSHLDTVTYPYFFETSASTHNTALRRNKCASFTENSQL